MEILKDGTPDRELKHEMMLVEKYDRILKYVIKLGFCYNDDIATEAHNLRAMHINLIEQKSNYKLICKLWKNGTCHVYDRAQYLSHMYGKKWRKI